MQFPQTGFLSSFETVLRPTIILNNEAKDLFLNSRDASHSKLFPE